MCYQVFSHKSACDVRTTTSVDCTFPCGSKDQFTVLNPLADPKPCDCTEPDTSIKSYLRCPDHGCCRRWVSIIPCENTFGICKELVEYHKYERIDDHGKHTALPILFEDVWQWNVESHTALPSLMSAEHAAEVMRDRLEDEVRRIQMQDFMLREKLRFLRNSVAARCPGHAPCTSDGMIICSVATIAQQCDRLEQILSKVCAELCEATKLYLQAQLNFHLLKYGFPWIPNFQVDTSPVTDAGRSQAGSELYPDLYEERSAYLSSESSSGRNSSLEDDDDDSVMDMDKIGGAPLSPTESEMDMMEDFKNALA